MNNKDFWSFFEKFFVEFIDGYFIKKSIKTPYGKLCIGLPNDDSLLWRGNADFSAKNITTELELLSKQYDFSNYGVYISPSWSGDITKFKHDLTALNWQKTFEVSWLKTNTENCSGNISLSNKFNIETVSLEDVQPKNELIALFDEVNGGNFGIHTLTNPINTDIKRMVSIVKTKNNQKAIALGFLAFDSEVGYLYSLSVAKEFRNNGIATAIVAEQLKILQKENIKNAVTAVVVKNKSSLKVQDKNGFKKFAITEAWQPENSSSGAYVIDESQQ